MPPDAHFNSTTPEHRSAAAVENVGDEDTQTVTICVSLSVVAIILGVCAVMCYREVNRRRKETLVIKEFARRESIKKSIKDKLQQLRIEDESTSYKEHMEKKVPQVTFSETVQINQAITPMSSSDDLEKALPPSPEPLKTRKQRPQRTHHMYQSYFDNIVKTQRQTRKIVVKLQQQQQQIAAQENNQTTALLPPTVPDEQLTILEELKTEKPLSETSTNSGKRYLKDDISQHPLGIPLKAPRRSVFSYFSRKEHRRQCSREANGNSLNLALVNGSKTV